MPQSMGTGRKKSGHRSNMGQVRNRQRYQANGHLRRNKIRNITVMLAQTAKDAYREFLQGRLLFWKKGLTTAGKAVE